MAKSDRLARLLSIILMIQSHPGLSAEELARRCEIGERQLFRDLQVLGEAGIPIYNDRGYRMVERFMLKNISLSLEEALSLIYGIKLLERQKGLFPATNSVREKLLALLPAKLGEEIEDLEQRVAVTVKPGVDYSGKEGLFKKLNEAVRQNLQLSMEYHSFTRDEMTLRLIDPYYLVFQEGFWYLVAFCHERNDFRLFRVDRILNLTEAGTGFKPVKGFNLENYLGAAWSMERGAEFTFKVRFWGKSARYVRETQFHPTQAVTPLEDSVIFTAKACGLKSVARWVLSFGGEAEVLEPGELREMVGEEFRKGMERYQKSEVKNL